MTVLIVGNPPFSTELETLCRAGGQTVTRLDPVDFIQNGADDPATVVIEVCHTRIKSEVLQAIGQVIAPETLILSSALTISATQAAAWVANPNRLVGFGILPPLSAKNQIEVTRALQTSQASWQQALDFWQALGQTSVEVADGPGLVRARVVCCVINEAVTAVQEDVATPADIDLAMKLGTNYPHGPLAWADLLGLDTVLGVMNGLYQEWAEDRYRPAPLLKRMVLAGQVGRRSGRGFYEYE